MVKIEGAVDAIFRGYLRSTIKKPMSVRRFIVLHWWRYRRYFLVSRAPVPNESLIRNLRLKYNRKLPPTAVFELFENFFAEILIDRTFASKVFN